MMKVVIRRNKYKYSSDDLAVLSPGLKWFYTALFSQYKHYVPRPDLSSGLNSVFDRISNVKYDLILYRRSSAQWS